MAASDDPLEDVDLDPELRRYLQAVWSRLETLSHYELLGVRRDADTGAIKRAYFGLARVVHPDRYYGKHLGEQKPRLEAIFARITEAYDTLRVPELRAAYDAELAQTAPSTAATPSAPPPVDPHTAARKQQALDALGEQLARMRAKAQQHAQAAERALAMGDLVGAEAGYREAVRLAPRDQGLAAALAQVQARLAQRTIDALRRQARLEEEHGHLQHAAASWRRVLALTPEDPEAITALAVLKPRLERDR